MSIFKNIITIVLLTLGISSFAQQQPAGSPDKEADKLLDLVSKRYKNFKTIKADFTYGMENKAEKQSEKQKGTLFVRGNKFKLDIAGQVIICDNENVWSFSKELNEVQVNKYNPKENAIRIEDIFTMYNKGFIYRIEDIKKEKDGREIATVELTPKDKKRNFFKIKLTIDKTNQTILKSMVYDKNGTVHTYTITNQVPNVKLTENFFTFNKSDFPGVEVIDLR